MSSLVDWELARRVARIAAGDGGAAMPGGAELASAAARSEQAVITYTGLTPLEPIPQAEWVSRREWAEINLESMRGLIGPVEVRMGNSLGSAANGALGGVAGRILAVQVGALLGLASKRVLGQYEFPLLGGERAPRLIFVGENIESAAGELGGKPSDVLEWVALHETTHAVHLSAAPWLRGHLGGLVRKLLEETPLNVSAAAVLAGARQFLSNDPRRLIAELRESDPVTLLAPAKSRETIASLQATMAIVEGYAEHVMDAAADVLGPAVEDLRAGLERRRANRGTLARLLSWLLGFEMKLRQYRDGKRFADDVVRRGGIGWLNRAWDGPQALPSLAELAAPTAWIERVGASSPA